MISWCWRSYWEGKWRARHEMLKQQHGCQSNFTPQWFRTSATSPIQLWTLCLLCVFIYFVSVSKTREAKQRETCPKCRRVSGVWSRDRERCVCGGGWKQRKATVGGCTLISARSLCLFKGAPKFALAQRWWRQIKHASTPSDLYVRIKAISPLRVFH